MLLIYNLSIYIYFFFLFPLYAYRFITSKKYKEGLLERMGFPPKRSAGRCILVHTVSVGEFLGALPFINELKRKYEGYTVIVSVTTVTGIRVARRRMEDAGNVVFFPLDFFGAARRFIDAVSPSLIVLLETELWPNFLHTAYIRDIPVIVVNGRISQKSYRRYMMLKGFFRDMCRGIIYWGMQDKGGRERLIGLGIGRDRIFVTGSMKFDSAILGSLSEEDVRGIRKDWGITGETSPRIIVGGSTHRGEEEILLDVYMELKREFTDIALILVPRHPERKDEIEAEIKKRGLGYILRTEWKEGVRVSDYDVVLVDRIGELAAIYNIASIVFIGKTMRKGGGQNPLEPAVCARPVIFGPMMWNFADISSRLTEGGGAVEVKNETELKTAAKRLLAHPDECREIGRCARDIVYSGAGALGRNMDLIKKAETEFDLP